MGRHMAVHTQGKRCRRMAQFSLHRLNVIPALNCHDRVGMLQVVELGVRRKAPLSGLSRPQKIPGSVRTRDFLFFLSTGPLLFLCRTAKIGLENIILGSVWQAVTRHIPIRVGSHSAQQSLTAPRTARVGSHPCHWGRLLEYITKERGSIPMKCFNHPDQDAVATCQKCGKGLCRECAAKYMPCMCDACVEWEQNVEQQEKRWQEVQRKQEYQDALVDTRNEFIKTTVFGIITGLALSCFMGSLEADFSMCVFMLIMGFGVPFGWKFFTYLQSFFPSMVIFGTIFFWLVLIWIKFGLSLFFGIPAFIYQLIKTISVQHKINKKQ